MGKIQVIAAVARNGVIGANGKMPWRLPADLKRFKQLTMGGALVMGRKTWDSIGKALPGRVSIVVTRNKEWHAPDALVVNSIEEALTAADGNDVWVIGGAEIYRQMLPLAETLHLTHIDADYEGDVKFPYDACYGTAMLHEETFRMQDFPHMYAFRTYKVLHKEEK